MLITDNFLDDEVLFEALNEPNKVLDLLLAASELKLSLAVILFNQVDVSLEEEIVLHFHVAVLGDWIHSLAIIFQVCDVVLG